MPCKGVFAVFCQLAYGNFKRTVAERFGCFAFKQLERNSIACRCFYWQLWFSRFGWKVVAVEFYLDFYVWAGWMPGDGGGRIRSDCHRRDDCFLCGGGDWSEQKGCKNQCVLFFCITKWFRLRNWLFCEINNYIMSSLVIRTLTQILCVKEISLANVRKNIYIVKFKSLFKNKC